MHREFPVPATIFTENWTAAGHRFRSMLHRQWLALDAIGGFDLSACRDLQDDPAPASVPATALVYRFGGDAASAGPGPRPVVFRMSGQAHVGEGGPEGPDAGARIVVPSNWSRAGVVAAGARADRVTVVAPGVDGAAFFPLSRVDREAVRANLGLAADETALLHVGDGGATTGIDLALCAFARLRTAGVRVRLILATDDPDGRVDYDGIVRGAAADEPALLDAGCLAAVTTVPGRLAPDGWRLLYAAADVLVAPDRGCAFPFAVLEALACGCPVVVTRGGAADDLCDDDLAWRIAGTVRPDAEGGRALAPDLDELTDALAAIAQGRGFDRLRFAAARMRLLREATWERSARRLADVLGVDEPRRLAGPGRAAVLRGTPQPVGDRFAAQPPSGLAAARRRATRRVTCPGPEELSVVVQGPCLRKSAEPGAPSIDEAIASIRRSFPGAQVVVSTWLGSDIDGLDADDIVLSPDPGPIEHPMHRPNNVNRMITSTANGLAAAHRKFCIKTRNDVLFASDALMHLDLEISGKNLPIDRRIWSSAARLETSLRPFYPCDMVQYGLRSDLCRLWDVGEWKWEDLFLLDPYGHLPRMVAEQAVFVGFLRNAGEDLCLDMTFDGRPEIIAKSIKFMLDAFDVFDSEPTGIMLSPRFRENLIRPKLYETRDSFEQLRALRSKSMEHAFHVVYSAFHATLRKISSSASIEA